MGEKNKQKCANKNICLLDENISYFSTLILLYFTTPPSMTKAKKSIAIRSNLKLIGWRQQCILKFNALMTEGNRVVDYNNLIGYLEQKAEVYPFNQCIVLEGHEWLIRRNGATRKSWFRQLTKLSSTLVSQVPLPTCCWDPQPFQLGEPDY